MGQRVRPMATPKTMAQNAVARLQPSLDNRLGASVSDRSMVAGIIGDHPSRYAKSPFIWNAAFQELNIDAAYVPFDVSAENLPHLVRALRECPAFVGGNVTVPHKVAVMELLDDVDPTAREIGAVNTICRTRDGWLVGYNTDAEGAIGSLIRATPGREAPFLNGLGGKRVLLIGAGGAGRGVAFGMGPHLGTTGSLAIANRSVQWAQELASQVARGYGNARAIDEEEVAGALEEVELVINASTRGQSGICRLPGGRVTCLEPYSCLAPANPATFDAGQHASEGEFYRAWHGASVEDIQANLEASVRAILRCRPGAAFFDLIYSPLETAFLAQARWSGHETLNGQGMNLIQAVEGFVNRVMGPYLEGQGWSSDQVYGRVMSAMAGAW